MKSAIANTILYSDNPATASELFSQRVEKSGYNRNLVAALPLIGDGRSAECILKAFVAGDAESREFSYSLMEQWPDIEIVHSLYEIVASGNKSYQDRAFREFCIRVQEENIPGEQKLLLARRIEPWATSDASLQPAITFVLGWHGPRYTHLRQRVLRHCQPVLWGKTPW